MKTHCRNAHLPGLVQAPGGLRSMREVCSMVDLFKHKNATYHHRHHTGVPYICEAVLQAEFRVTHSIIRPSVGIQRPPPPPFFLFPLE